MSYTAKDLSRERIEEIRHLAAEQKVEGMLVQEWELVALCDRALAPQVNLGPDGEWLAKVEEALRRSKLIAAFLDVGFWSAHHVDLRWRINGEDRWEQADWLSSVWYAVRRKIPGQAPLSVVQEAIHANSQHPDLR